MDEKARCDLWVRHGEHYIEADTFHGHEDAWFAASRDEKAYVTVRVLCNTPQSAMP